MSKFFIDRPIFAWVIAILISLIGILSLMGMPVEQYPKIAPPAVTITANLPGASAEVLENTVTQVIEQGLTGIDHLRYFSSSSSSSGSVSITLTFEQGTDPDIAQVQVQNKLQSITALLPQALKEQGINVSKGNEVTLLFFAFYSDNDNVRQETFGDILSTVMKDSISRINGVGSVGVFAGQHAIRIWLLPHKLYSYNLTASEVSRAISAQNINVTAGQLGGLPAVSGQQLTANINAGTMYRTTDEFKNIILRTNADGSVVRLRDVASVEMGGDYYSTITRYKKRVSAGMAIRLVTGGNALEVADQVKKKVSELSKFLPEGVKVVYPYDTTPFVKISIQKVIQTLIEAFILVFLVMFLFLQNFRSTLIPTITIPVVILGTFAVLYAFGFSVNTLTMFALVLAIGLLVDDAIVVVENVERLMEEEGLSPKEASYKSMEQITGALVGIALVLSAVFVPMAFFSGSAGGIYRQFSITIVAAMTFSVIVSLVLAPSLCATLLKPNHVKKNKLFNIFNNKLDKSRDFYTTNSGKVAKRVFRFLLIYVALIGVVMFLFSRMPTSFLPNEDQGVLFGIVSTPPGATLERTSDNVKIMENYLLEAEKNNVEHIFSVTGYGFAGMVQNSALVFIMLKDWSERKGKQNSATAIAGRAMFSLSKVKDAFMFVVSPPPIRELGNATGFEMQLLDMGGLGHSALMQARNQLLGMASQSKLLSSVRPNGFEDVPEYRLIIDYNKATSLGIAIEDITSTLSIVWGSYYVNDFLDRGRVKKVFIQGEAGSRMLPEDVNKWFVKNNKGEMVSFASFSHGEWAYSSPLLERFNGVSSINIQGTPALGISSGVAMKEMENLVAKLPQGIGFAWSGLSYEEKQAGSNTTALYILSMLIVFLSLAALYESWSVPFSVMLTIPFGIFGALVASTLTGKVNDIYFQVAILTTIGLSAKNAILIVEFAKDLYEKGYNIFEATAIATKQRFRPILMTSMAFILGVVPLALATGAGSASQNALGIAVLGGMFSSTFIAPLFVPLFYILTQRNKKVDSNKKDI